LKLILFIFKYIKGRYGLAISDSYVQNMDDGTSDQSITFFAYPQTVSPLPTEDDTRGKIKQKEKFENPIPPFWAYFSQTDTNPK
jgi:hypothetical protein